MRGHNVNIYFSEENYQKIKPLIEQRKISEFVNKLVERELEEKEQLKKRLISGYQIRAKNEKLKKTLQTYGEMSWEDLSVKLNTKQK